MLHICTVNINVECVRTIDRCADICCYGSEDTDVNILKSSWCKIIQFSKSLQELFVLHFVSSSAM